MAVATDGEKERHYLKKVENTCILFIKIWNISLVLNLDSQLKWDQDSETKENELINVIQRGNVAMPRIDPIRIVRSNSGVYEVLATEVDADVNRDASADCDCCCDGHCNLTPIPGVKMADVNPFSTLMAADVIPHVYPEAEDDEFVGDLPLPGEKDALYAVLAALEMKFDLDVCQEDTDTSLSH